MPKALLFDLDGTLSNTDAIHFPNWIEILRPYGVEVTRELYEEKLSGWVDRRGVEAVLPDLSDEEADALLETEELRARQRASEIGPLPGLRGLLEAARRRGLPIALVTNSPREDANEVLQPLGLDGIFDPVVYQHHTGDGEDKPDAAPYERALEELGLPAGEVVAFEDSPTGASAAVEAGIPVVGISTGHAPEELSDTGVEIVVGDYMDPALYDFLGWD